MGSSIQEKKDWFDKDVATVSQSGGFLSPLSFRYLEQMRGKPLEIPFLKTLSHNLSLPLAGHVGPLILDGLQEITPQATRALASHGGMLSLNGLHNLSLECAALLKNHEGPLQLNGLSDLPGEMAASLASHRGDLHLNGLMALTEGAAVALAEHRGALYLDGISLLNDRSAFALSTHEGKLSLKTLLELSSFQTSQGEGMSLLIRKIQASDQTTEKAHPFINPVPAFVPQQENVAILDQALSFDEDSTQPPDHPFLPGFGIW